MLKKNMTQNYMIKRFFLSVNDFFFLERYMNP